MPRSRVRLCVAQTLESRMLLAANSLMDVGSDSVCLAVGDPHAQPTPMVATMEAVARPIATTELPTEKVAPAVEGEPKETQPSTQPVAEPESVGTIEVISTEKSLDETVEPNEEPAINVPGTQESAQDVKPVGSTQIKSPLDSLKKPQTEITEESLVEESQEEATPSETAIVPQVALIDLGGDQRSVIDEFVIVFDSAVDVDWSHGDLITLVNRNTQAEVNVVATLESANGATQIRVRFAAGPSVESATNSPSLADGNYELTLNASRISLGGEALDGDGNGVGGDDYVFGTQASDQFFRLFGDQDGDRDVDSEDYDAFVAALLSTAGSGNFDARFDSDDDGDVDGKDYGSYLTRHQTALAFV